MIFSKKINYILILRFTENLKVNVYRRFVYYTSGCKMHLIFLYAISSIVRSSYFKRVLE